MQRVATAWGHCRLRQARVAFVARFTFLSRSAITKPHIRKATVRTRARACQQSGNCGTVAPVECGTKDMQLIAYAMPLDQVGAGGGSGVIYS